MYKPAPQRFSSVEGRGKRLIRFAWKMYTKSVCIKVKCSVTLRTGDGVGGALILSPYRRIYHHGVCDARPDLWLPSGAVRLRACVCSGMPSRHVLGGWSDSVHAMSTWHLPVGLRSHALSAVWTWHTHVQRRRYRLPGLHRQR